MILIKNGKILAMNGKSLEKGSILVKDTRIARVAEKIEVPKNPECQIIDAQGLWVMPGLIDAHSHIGISEERKSFEGNDCNEGVEPIIPYIRAIDAINPMDKAFDIAIRTGITTVMVGQGSANVVGGQFAVIKTYGRVIDDMIILQPSAIKVAFGENPKSFFESNDMMPSTRMSIAALLREELFNARGYYNKKLYALNNNEEFEEDFEYECWIPVLKREIPIKAHVHRADDILTAIRIAKEFNLKMTLDHCTEGHFIVPSIKKSGFPAIIGPSLASRNKIEIQNMSFKTAGILAREGVKVAITTDHPVSRINCLPLCAGFAVKEGLSLEEGLKSITINAAQICNVADRVGSIEVGKDADIAIFNGNPMETFTRTMYTIIDGKIVYNYYESQAIL